MKQATVKVTNFAGNECKVKIKCLGYTDSNEDGATGFEDRVLGWGRFTLLAKHRQEMIDFYEGRMPTAFDMENDWCEGQDAESNNGDQFIFYVHFLMNTKKKIEFEVYAEHIFWFIHDVYHAENDVCGRDMNCSPREKLERFQQAYATLKKNKLGMRPDYVKRIVEAFNQRNWGCYGDWSRIREKITADSIKELN